VAGGNRKFSTPRERYTDVVGVEKPPQPKADMPAGRYTDKSQRIKPERYNVIRTNLNGERKVIATVPGFDKAAALVKESKAAIRKLGGVIGNKYSYAIREAGEGIMGVPRDYKEGVAGKILKRGKLLGLGAALVGAGMAAKKAYEESEDNGG
jgi:hypothetical protein